MKKYGIMIFVGLLTLGFMLGGVYVPVHLMGQQRGHLLETVSVSESTETEQEDLSIIQQGAVAQSYNEEERSWMEYEPIEGQMSEEEAVSKAVTEAAKLCRKGVLSSVFSNMSDWEYTARHGTKKYGDGESPVILSAYGCWILNFRSGENAVTFYMNSVNGKVYGMEVFSKAVLGVEEQKDAEEYGRSEASAGNNIFSARNSIGQIAVSYVEYLGWEMDQDALVLGYDGAYCQLKSPYVVLSIYMCEISNDVMYMQFRIY